MTKEAKPGEEVVMGARYLWLLMALTLTFTGLGQWVIWEENFETQALSTAYKTTVGWHIVDRSWFYGEPEGIRAFPSGSRALYFGKIVNGKGTYDAGTRVFGSKNDVRGNFTQLKSPHLYTVDWAWFRVSFKYVREVEYFQWGSFDKTEATCKDTIFKKTSEDPSEKEWKTFVSEPIQNYWYDFVQFFFDSIDGTENNFFGWLIDDVKVEAVVVITTLPSSLSSGQVGTTYTSTIEARGGVRKNGQYKWKVEGLPEGLRYRSEGDHIVIEGTPTKAGAYQVKVTVTDYASEASDGTFPDSTTTKTFTLVISPTAQEGQAQFAENFENGSGPDIPGWTRTGLWHRRYGIVNSNNWGAYYAIPGANDYNTGETTYGELISPRWNVADCQGQQIYIEFWHRREVEPISAPGAPTGYDRTYVQIRFDNGEWRTVWYKDSRESSDWNLIEKVEIDDETLLLPPEASTLQIRFVFDSVDKIANNYKGWAIDDVRVELKAGRFEITTETLPRGQVGVYYEAQLQARGGAAPYTWVITKGEAPGLELTRDGKLRGVPRQEGTFTLEIEVRDAQNNVKSDKFSLIITKRTLLFYDDFATKTDAWTADGLWHRTDQVKTVNLTGYGHVMYFGKDELTNPNYSTGARVMGYLTSKSFPIDEGVKHFRLTFDYWREVEFYAPGGYDKTYVEVRFLVGSTWSQWHRVWYQDSAYTSEKAWRTVDVAHEIPAGATEMQIRFAFDSVDRFYNNYVGWLIDNVKVEIATYGTPLPTSSLDILTRPRGDFAVFNVPNPVRDVHTTTFVVRGVEADLVKVEVYDLTGRLVYMGEALGNELVWHTQDLLGRYLANGVYLYKVYVKVGDTWIVSDTQKIVILR